MLNLGVIKNLSTGWLVNELIRRRAGRVLSITKFLIQFTDALIIRPLFTLLRIYLILETVHLSPQLRRIRLRLLTTLITYTYELLLSLLRCTVIKRILHIHWTDFVSNDIRDNRSCQLLSVNGACPSLVICAVPTPVKTTPELSRPGIGVLPKTGDEELEDRGNPGWERLRMICARSTLAWRRQDGELWIDRHGVYSWMRLRPRDTLQRERERESNSNQWPI